MRLPHPHLLVGTCVLCCAQAFGQTPPVSSPQALSLAAQSLRSLAGGTTLADVTMQATANYTFRAKNEVGTATLVARGNTQSLLTLNFSDGTGWQEIRNRISGVSVNADGTVTSSATHNCFIDADWFFPALSLQALANDPTSVVNLPGQQIYEGQQVYHLTFTRYLTGQVPEVSSLFRPSAPWISTLTPRPSPRWRWISTLIPAKTPTRTLLRRFALAPTNPSMALGLASESRHARSRDSK